MWEEFVKHPCWVQIVRAIKERIEANKIAIVDAARKGEFSKVSYYAGNIDELEWVLHLPEYLSVLEKRRK